MTLQPFNVVVVPFPHNDRSAEKRRSALVVSHRDLPARLRRVWVAMITSVPHEELGDLRLTDIESAGLPAASTLRASKIATLDAARVIRVRGGCRTPTRTWPNAT